VNNILYLIAEADVLPSEFCVGQKGNRPTDIHDFSLWYDTPATATGVSDKKRYVKAVRLNGKPYDKLYITHADIMAGGTLEFEMSSSPNKRRCITTGKPYSLSDDAL